MVIRTLETIFYTSNHILNRSVHHKFKRIIVIILEILVITFLINIAPSIEIKGYKEWILQALMVVNISAFIVMPINSFIYKDNIKDIIKRIKRGKIRK